MNRWNLTKPYRNYVITGGVYSVSTKNGKLIYGYAKSKEDAFFKTMDSISRDDEILSIWRTNV